MAQSQNIGLLAQYIAVNTAANSATFSTAVVAGAISIGNSSVNVSINSTSVSSGGAALITAANVSVQYAWTNTQSFSNTITFNGGIVSTNTISANGGVGTAGQVLTSAGTGANVYWAAAAPGTNVAAQYAWTNTQSFSAVVTHTANVSVNGAIIANGGAGTSGQVLTSSAGGNVYWAAAAGGFTNGQSISVSNLAVTGVLSANGGTGTAGQALISGGAGNTYWANAGGGFTNGQSISVSNLAFANTSNTASTYTFYNTSTASLDTVFV